MRFFLKSIGFFSLLMMLSLPVKTYGGVVVGAPAPDFTLLDSNGVAHSVAQYKDKIVVLEWTNHLCPFVKKHYSSGNMQALQKKYTDQSVVWLSVISSAEGKQGFVTPYEANEQTTSRKAAPTAVLLDPLGRVGKLYGARTTPHVFIIDKQGTLVYQGAVDDIPSSNVKDIEQAQNYVQPALDELLAGKPVSLSATKPYGCSVKY